MFADSSKRRSPPISCHSIHIPGCLSSFRHPPSVRDQGKPHQTRRPLALDRVRPRQAFSPSCPPSLPSHLHPRPIHPSPSPMGPPQQSRQPPPHRRAVSSSSLARPQLVLYEQLPLTFGTAKRYKRYPALHPTQSHPRPSPPHPRPPQSALATSSSGQVAALSSSPSSRPSFPPFRE